MLETPALIAATAGLIPLMLIAAYIDFKTLKVRNWLVLAVFALFLVTGLWGLPLDSFLWRLGLGVAFLVLGFFANMFFGHHVGAGDVKLIAVLLPFFEPESFGVFVTVYLIITVGWIVLQRRLARRAGAHETGWAALDQGLHYPFGVFMGLTMCIYMLGIVSQRLGWGILPIF